VVIARGVTLVPGAHETNNDALNNEGRHFQTSLFSKETLHTRAMVDVRVRIHQARRRASNDVFSFSIRRRCVEKQQQKRNDIFMFICYFSTNKNDTLFSIESLDSPSNSKSIRCLTLLRSMECSSRLEILPFLAPVMVEKTTPPYESYR
jgi:hypothetical protein